MSYLPKIILGISITLLALLRSYLNYFYYTSLWRTLLLIFLQILAYMFLTLLGISCLVLSYFVCKEVKDTLEDVWKLVKEMG